MNDASLEKLLSKLAVPPVDESVRDKALYRAEIAFANRHTDSRSEDRLPACLGQRASSLLNSFEAFGDALSKAGWMKKAVSIGALALGVAI